MPQLTQLPVIFWSQLFWLAVVFAIIYFVIARGMVPKIQSTVDDREKKVAADLAAAQAAREEADRTEEAYRQRIDAGRAETTKLTGKAKDESARLTEKALAEADEQVQARIAEAEAGIRKARQAALKDIESAAAELAQEIAAKVARVEVAKPAAERAVKEVMADA